MPIKITSRKHNFRRCGMEHPKDATVYPDGKFTPDDIAILKADPMLTVEMIAEPVGETGGSPGQGECESPLQKAETRNPKPKTRK